MKEITIDGGLLRYISEFNSLWGNWTDYPLISKDYQIVLVVSPKTLKIGKFIFEKFLFNERVIKYAEYEHKINLYINLTK